MMEIHGNDNINEETQTLPLETRKRQLDSLITLTNTIKATHEEIASSEKWT